MSETNTGDVSAAPIEAEPVAPVEEVVPTETKVETKRKFKLKVDGAEIEEEFDPSNEEELVKRLQLQKVAQKRMEESSLTKKQAEALVQSFKSDPIAVMQQLGIDPREISESYLSKMLEEQLLTPEQKEVREAKRIIEEHKRQVEEQAKQKEQQELQTLEAKYAAEYQKTIIDALESSGLPKTKRSMQRIVQAMRMNLEKGTSFDPMVVAKIAREDYEQEMQEIVSGFQDDDQLIAFLGKSTDRIRKADLKRFQAQPKSFQQAKPQVSKEQEPQRKLTKAEWRKKMEQE